MNKCKLSIIIPCLNEAETIETTLMALQSLRQRGHEIILSDGGSSDKTVTLAQTLVDHCICSQSGRAMQMNAGANIASGDILCFLHADTLAPATLDKIIVSDFHTSNQLNQHYWGFFNIKLNSRRWSFRVIEWCINKRSCLSKVATGDQAIFMSARLFHTLSGYAEIPLMEDIELTKRLKKISPPNCIKKPQLITSSRRWEKHGIINTVLLMWKLRFAYFTGTPPGTLAQAYTNHAADK